MIDEPDQRCLHCYISGRVQGVFFRETTRQQAKQLGLSGYARNLDDGRVEVIACGSLQTLARFKEWLWQGPSHAKVTAVHCEYKPYEPMDGFRIKY